MTTRFVPVRDIAVPTDASLADRLAALDRFVQHAAPYLPAERLNLARELVERANQRLELSRDHTVVALAGATGGGKSSLFNTLAGKPLSPVGVRRPTTGDAHACVFGPAGQVTRMLDWLAVTPALRFTPAEAPGRDLAGLVLLDLPDFDSLAREHGAQVNRLLEQVDMVVWVVDPQKYADQLLHDRHLARFRRHHEVTVVALNQADRLSPTDLERVRSDLRRLLDEGGLADVSIVTTSAVVDPPGAGELRRWLARRLASRASVIRRLSADLEVTAEDLSDLIGTPPSDDPLEQAAGPLAEGLAEAAGLPAALETWQEEHRWSAVAAMRWPPERWLRRLRPDPLWSADDPAPVAGVGAPVSRAAVELAVRPVAGPATAGLPAPWAEAVATAARSHVSELPEALTDALSAARRRTLQPAGWWRAVATWQWVTTAAALLGAGWLLVEGVAVALGASGSPPRVGPVALPLALLAGGVLAGVLTTLLVRPLAAWSARLAAARAEGPLRAALAEAGHRYVLAPAAAVMRAYREATEALATARGRDTAS